MYPIEIIKKSWYLVYTKPRKECLAQEHLERQGYMTYLPQMRTARRRNGKRYYQTEPFFPRYLFIALDTINDNWAPIRSTSGVANIVRFGQMPQTVPDILVENIKARENPGTGLHEIDTAIKSGDKVRILDGPMADYEGIFMADSGGERVTILLTVMGKQARVKIHADAVALSG